MTAKGEFFLLITSGVFAITALLPPLLQIPWLRALATLPAHTAKYEIVVSLAASSKSLSKLTNIMNILRKE